MSLIDRLAGSASINAPIRTENPEHNFGTNIAGEEQVTNKNINQPKKVERPSETNIHIGRNPHQSPTSPISKTASANPLEGFNSSYFNSKYSNYSPNTQDETHGQNCYFLA